MHPYDDYVLEQSLVGGPTGGRIEDDLFAGVRTLTPEEVEAIANRSAAARHG